MRIAGTEYNLNHYALEIYLSGCMKPRCEGCHNPELWDSRVGDKLTLDKIKEIIQKVNENELIASVWIMGGEPLDQNPEDLIELLTDLKDHTDAAIWVWTKRELDEVPEYIQNLTDYLKCGRYEKDNPSDHIECGVQLASANQHVFERGLDYPYYFRMQEDTDVDTERSVSESDTPGSV